MRSCNELGETTLTRRTLNLGLVAGALLPFPAQASHLFDVRAFGAKGEGQSIDSGAVGWGECSSVMSGATLFHNRPNET